MLTRRIYQSVHVHPFGPKGLLRDHFDLGIFDFGDIFGEIRKHMGGEGGALWSTYRRLLRGRLKTSVRFFLQNIVDLPTNTFPLLVFSHVPPSPCSAPASFFGTPYAVPFTPRPGPFLHKGKTTTRENALTDQRGSRLELHLFYVRNCRCSSE